MSSPIPPRLRGYGATFWAAICWMTLVVFAAITASWLPLDPNALDPSRGGLSPRISHPFGTTRVGEDVFAVVVHGSRVALIIGIGAALLALVVGATIGVIAGYFRGWVDTIATTLLDAVVAFPTYVLALALVLFLGQHLLTLVLVIGLLAAPVMARVSRTATRAIVDRDFVLAARMAGARHKRVIAAELAPNVVVPILAYTLLVAGAAILAEGALSFVGLGVSGDKASWGRLVAGGRDSLQQMWWWSMCPTIVIFLTILSVNLINDRLQARWLFGAPLPKARRVPGSVRSGGRSGGADPAQHATLSRLDSVPRPDPAILAGPATAAAPAALMQDPTPRLAIEGLSVVIRTPFGDATIIDDVSLRVAPGRVLAIVGESGAGKTMLARSVIGLLPAGASVSGRVMLDGVPLDTGMDGRRGRDVAIVFQDPQTSLDPVMKVGWQIAEPAQVHLGLRRSLAREHALALLEQVGIGDPERRFRQYPHELSGGLRQRAAIALALSCGPGLLIADEPTSALDVTVQAQILALLDRLRRDRHMAVLLITHDLNMATSYADEVAVMYAGRIVERSSASSLYAVRRMPYTEALFESVPLIGAPAHQRLRAIPGQPPNPFLRPPGCAFAPRCSRVGTECITSAPPLVERDGHASACWYAD